VARVHGVVDPHPQGKILEGVDIVTLDVFEKRDPFPSFMLGFVPNILCLARKKRGFRHGDESS